MFQLVLVLFCLVPSALAFWPQKFSRATKAYNIGFNPLVLFDGATSPAVPPSMSPLKARLNQDMKTAMVNKEKNKLAAIRAVLTAIKQKEVDDRVEQSDEMIVSIMSKLIKQRKESIKSYQDGNRADLAAAEQEECDFISAYMPVQMSEDEIVKHIDEMIQKVGATTIKDMGKVMAQAKPFFNGKADMALVGEILKKKLGGK
eukprot:gene28973-34965_t